MRPSGRAALLILLAVLTFPARAGSPPKVTHSCSKVHTSPRPCKAAVQVTRHTTLYFEVTVPSTNPARSGSIRTASPPRSSWPGGGPVRCSARPGLGRGVRGADDRRSSPTAGARGYGFYIDPQRRCSPRPSYTVSVGASDPPRRPRSTRRRRRLVVHDAAAARGATALLRRRPAPGPALTWQGRFFAGMIKPNFGTSAPFYQEPVYAADRRGAGRRAGVLAPAARLAAVRRLLAGQRLLRRQPQPGARARDAADHADPGPGHRTVLTAGRHARGAALRHRARTARCRPDYHAGDRVLVCDRDKCETTTVPSPATSRARSSSAA